MSRISGILTLSVAAAALLGLSQLGGCGQSDEMSAVDQANWAALVACHLADGTVTPHDQLRACNPNDTKKTTICHIPPGNPANAHTLCVGNAAVPAHIQNHGDSVGPCVNEKPCPPPTGAGGTGGDATGGAPGTGGMATGGAPGTGGIVVP
jgi:hypothetical protein